MYNNILLLTNTNEKMVTIDGDAKMFPKKIAISRKSIIITEFKKQFEIILLQNIDMMIVQQVSK